HHPEELDLFLGQSVGHPRLGRLLKRILERVGGRWLAVSGGPPGRQRGGGYDRPGGGLGWFCGCGCLSDILGEACSKIGDQIFVVGTVRHLHNTVSFESWFSPSATAASTRWAPRSHPPGGAQGAAHWHTTVQPLRTAGATTSV